ESTTFAFRSSSRPTSARWLATARSCTGTPASSVTAREMSWPVRRPGRSTGGLMRAASGTRARFGAGGGVFAFRSGGPGPRRTGGRAGVVTLPDHHRKTKFVAARVVFQHVDVRNLDHDVLARHNVADGLSENVRSLLLEQSGGLPGEESLLIDLPSFGSPFD